MAAVAIVVFLIALGVLIFALAALGKFEKPVTNTIDHEKPEKKINTYGHPLDIVGEIKRQIPKAPTNHVWEIGVKEDSSGRHLYLELKDINLKVVERHAVDIVFWLKTTGVKYEQKYTDYGIHKDLGRILCRENIINPMVGWATKIQYHYRPSSTIEKHIIN